MTKFRLSTRLYLLVALAVIILVATMVLSLSHNFGALEKERKASLAAMNANALSLIKTYYDQEVAGKLTREQAQGEAKRLIGTMRYDNGSGYFWINDMYPRMVMHPIKPELNGSDLTQNKDPNGKFLFVEFVNTVKATGQGFVNYDWPKPGAEKPVEKYSHVAGFAPWGWVVGTGVYVDDLKALYWQMALRFAAMSGIGMLLLAGSALMIVKSVTQPVGRIRAAVQRMAAGEPSIAIDGVEARDELGDIARSLVVLRDAVDERALLQKRDADQQRALAEDRERAAGVVRQAAERQSEAMQALGAALEALSRGDLSVSLGDLGADFAKVRDDFNSAVGSLRRTIEEISRTGHVVGESALEISRATGTLQQRTEQQAAALEQAASALEEITATVKTASERAAEARAMVADTKTSAGRSGEIVRDAVDAMGRIEDSSSRIGQIISVIDEIAFQTNLLALNAGVEAARAGEAGRGFAVVAQEVRELAQRSAHAAKEIKALINSSAREVEAGVSLVRTTGEALVDIVRLVEKVNAQVEGIATAAREQASGLQEINTSVNHMDQMTQQNKAMVHESAAAGQTLAAQSQQLRDLLEGFRLSGTGTGTGTGTGIGIALPRHAA
ncbi:methyl-accepting chemotaxis sensory transducer with Cache sensor [Rhizobium sp. RU35A]|uniref:methyl-accepting chemotaxis protein n=1 Tax=Rhizobium sp. RU35A TaxID=1907414 RepID=UPI000953D4A2|nr:methyl-accepting chemotaxis protein [Rhizobium sp. RU35A]SIR02677.1 methyl-accepting chemotaxis sensory transducer with Cache sensor [Rhizobium sp. RU35A]